MNFVRLHIWESVSTRPWYQLLTGAGDFGNGVWSRIRRAGTREKTCNDFLSTDPAKLMLLSVGFADAAIGVIGMNVLVCRGLCVGRSILDRSSVEMVGHPGLQSSVFDVICPCLANTHEPAAPR